MRQFEAFAGFEHKYNYSMVGHSGDTPCAPLVAYGSPPDNEKQRLQVVQRMAAHTQFCMSGDHTLEATRDAIAEAASHTDCDEVAGHRLWDVVQRAARKHWEPSCVVCNVRHAHPARVLFFSPHRTTPHSVSS